MPDHARGTAAIDLGLAGGHCDAKRLEGDMLRVVRHPPADPTGRPSNGAEPRLDLLGVAPPEVGLLPQQGRQKACEDKVQDDDDNALQSATSGANGPANNTHSPRSTAKATRA